MKNGRKRNGGFSLIELVIVVVIIAIIGAIAIPRMSRGSAGAGDSALTQDLSVLRGALDLYQTEHGGAYPALADIATALTGYTDSTGAHNATWVKDAATGKTYGPYLRAVPPLPVGATKGGTAFVGAYSSTTSNGWIYDGAGNVTANTAGTEADVNGKLYTAY